MQTFLGQLQQDASDYEQNTLEYTYQRNETVFFPENSTDFASQKLPEEIQSKIVYFCSVINEYSLRSRDVHSTPSWHKWSDFEYRLWCLAMVVRTPPDKILNAFKNTFSVLLLHWIGLYFLSLFVVP